MDKARRRHAAWRAGGIVLFALAPLGLSAGQTEWPSLRGPNHDGSASPGSRFGRTAGSLTVRWRAKLGSGYSGVVIASGRAVTMFSDGRQDVAVAFDVGTGQQAWRIEIGPTLNGRDGSFDGPISTPAIADGRVFALGPRGQLVAVELATGRLLWRADLVAREGARQPDYGFASSPIVVNGVLVVEIGADKGRAVAGFDPATGARRWTAGDDAVQYQSPVMLRVGRRDLVIAMGDTRLFGIEPETGRLVFEYAHGGRADPIGGASAVPVPAGEGRLFVKTEAGRSTMLRLAESAEGSITVQAMWTAPVLHTTYSPPVFHDGYLFGMSGRAALACVEAATGQIRWRSRQPGDGFLALVGNDLVVLTKDRTLHIAPASPEGWKERARIELFSDIAWTPPSVAAGGVFARSLGELARVDWTSAAVGSESAAISRESVASPTFARFLTEVEGVTDKSAVVDRLLASAPTGPLVESDRVVFLYRGDASDVGIITDLIGPRREDPMRRVPGTDLFFYEARLEPGARVSYQFVRNFDAPMPDPRNPRRVPAVTGRSEASSLAMPGWREPDHLAERPGPKGRLEPVELSTTMRGGARATLHVYLPVGYDQGDRRYPAAYVLDGDEARVAGLVPRSLDGLIPGRVAPVIVVFVGRIDWQQPPAGPPEEGAAMLDLFLKEVVPLVDARFRTIRERTARAVLGADSTGIIAAVAGFGHPDLFGGVGLQSVLLLDTPAEIIRSNVRGAAEWPMRVYHDWGRYGHAITREGADMLEANRQFSEFLRTKGYLPAGGEALDGFGWASWRNRTDRLFEALFPPVP
ncbi:MAG: PQQ-binding-like beta-propeller repeat protein [Vicinamibacterales bacterium]